MLLLLQTIRVVSTKHFLAKINLSKYLKVNIGEKIKKISHDVDFTLYVITEYTREFIFFFLRQSKYI